MEAKPRNPERFEPAKPLRYDIPFGPAEAVADDDDDNTDVLLAEEDEPGGGEDNGPPNASQLSGADT